MIYQKLGAGQPAFSVATRVSDWEIQRPLWPLDPDHMVLSARYMQLRVNYAPIMANAQLEENPAPFAVFVGDSPIRDLRGGLCEFTRTYATVPVSYTDFESYSLQYPGFDDIGSARDPFSLTTLARLDYDYFLIGANGAFGSPTLIPVEYSNLPDVAYLTASTYPTPAIYYQWRINDQNSPANYSIRPNDSELTRYMGNIWRRLTRRVKAR